MHHKYTFYSAKILNVALLLAATLLQAACGGGGSASSTSSNTTDPIQAQVLASIEPLSSRCANGGTRIDAWLDANGNGVLDAGEVSNTQYVCVGITAAVGATGLTGAAGMLV